MFQAATVAWFQLALLLMVLMMARSFTTPAEALHPDALSPDAEIWAADGIAWTN